MTAMAIKGDFLLARSFGARKKSTNLSSVLCYLEACMPTPNARNKDFALHILKAIPSRDREVLIRFYVRGETAQNIKEAMDLTEAQFRLIKSRAKKEFAQLSQSQTRKSAPSEVNAMSYPDPKKDTAIKGKCNENQ
jgi:hypothetical protein